MKGKGWIAKLQRFQDIYAKIEEHITACIFILMCVSLVIQISNRFVFKLSVPWSEELIRYSFIAVAFAGAGAVLKEGTHIEVNLLSGVIDNIKSKVKKQKVINMLTLIRYILIMVISIYIAVLCYNQTSMVFVMGQLTPALKIPMWLVNGVILYGFISIIIHSLIKIIVCLGTWEKVQERGEA
ncbi:MAG: TRAP transporter small permease subunit [Firmicutes bacterium]|nr:TRAP transporter small permease subunit [Bacillota bacterium]